MPDRLQREEEALQAAGIGYRRVEAAFAAGVAQYTLTVSNADGPFDLLATFPDAYPYFKPFVSAAGLGLAHHWNPTSAEVCLLGGGGWRPETDTLARLVEEQWPLVLTANAGGGRDDAGRLLEEDQAEPVSVYAEFERGTDLILTADPELPSGAAAGEAQFAVTRVEPLRGYVLGLRAPDQSVVAVADRLQAGPLPTVRGSWVRLVEAPADLSAKGFWLAAVAAEPELRRDLGWAPVPGSPATGRAAALGPQMQVILVGFPEELARRQIGTGWVALVRRRPNTRKPGGQAQLVRVSRAGHRDLLQRAPELASLSEKNVLIIGGGGLGSALWTEFGRLPLRDLTVVDGDVVDAATSVRFPSAARLSGIPKAEALLALAKEAQPFTQVAGLSARVGAARPDLDGEDQHAQLIDFVTTADLVIDATADVDAQYYLSNLCREQRTAYLQAEATPGVWGGLVALYGPDETYCWVCLQHYLADEDDDTVPAPFRSSTPDIQPPGCATPTYTGTGFDLGTIAMHAVRVAVSYLTGEAGYGEFADTVFTIRLREDDGRPIPATWDEHPLDRHPACRNHR